MVRTTEMLLRCPDIHTQEDEMIIGQTLDGSPGIDRIEVDVQHHQVHVTTANQDGGTDVRRLLISAGYPPAN